MRKILVSLSSLALIASGIGAIFTPSAFATVSLSSGPNVLVSSPKTLPASSAPTALFSVSLSGNATDTLTSIAVQVDKANASTTVSGSDIASLALYKDDGSNTFNPTVANLVGTQTAINIGSPSLITPATTTPASGKFYVSLATGGTWSGSSPADSITVTLPANAIVTSANSPTTLAVTTSIISADTVAPTLTSAVAQNTGGTSNKEAGDSIQLSFNEATNKPTIRSSTINSFFTLNNGHSLLDAGNNLGNVSWNASGTVLTITLSGASTTTVPTVSVGDVVTVVPSNAFTDAAGNQVTGTQAITGDFGGAVVNPPTPGSNCSNGIINGRLYTVTGYKYVYLAADCRLKLFKGKSYYRARGHKFQDVINLPTFPKPGKELRDMKDRDSRQSGNFSGNFLKFDELKHGQENQNHGQNGNENEKHDRQNSDKGRGHGRSED